MAFWNRKRGERAEERDTSGLATPEVWLQDALLGPETPAGERVTVEKALGLVPVWAAVRIISEQIGLLPLKVYREVDGVENAEARGYRGWRLLHDMPNPYTPAGRFWATVAVHLLLWGNAFIHKVRDSSGLVDELYLFKPAEMTVLWNPATGEKRFRHTPQNIIGQANTTEYSDFEVLHIFGLSLDGIVGESVISHCRGALGAAIGRDKYEGSFYKRGARVPFGLSTDGQLSDTARSNIRESMKGYQGSANAWGIPLFEEGVKPVPIGTLMKDLEFVAAQQLTRTDIAVMFNLPPNTLGGSSGDSLTYSTVEMEQQHIALHAVAPLTTTIDQALTHDPSILPQRVFSCAFDLNAMMRADSKTRAEVYTAALNPETGWMNRSEVRLRENLFPADDGPTEVPDAPPADLAGDEGQVDAATGS